MPHTTDEVPVTWATTQQSMPTPGAKPVYVQIVDQIQLLAKGRGLDQAQCLNVAAECLARVAVGTDTYGAPLCYDAEGRSHLIDGFQEAIDLAFYLEAASAQRPALKRLVKRALWLVLDLYQVLDQEQEGGTHE